MAIFLVKNYCIQAWWPLVYGFAWGLVGFADFADGYYTTH
jgi:hypothetical protein